MSMLRGSQKYQMSKKGMNSMKKKSLKKKGKKMPEKSEMQPMEVIPKGFTGMKKMAYGGAVSRGMGKASRGGKYKYC